MTRSFFDSLLPTIVGGICIAGSCCLVCCDRGSGNKARTESAVAAKVEGGALNKFFPSDDGDYDVIFTMEKEGFVQAKLENDGVELGTLSVSDLLGDADALGKYAGAALKIGGYPAVTRGSKGTALLAGRFQVQARAKDAAFTPADREQWLQRFDLAGLEKLAK